MKKVFYLLAVTVVMLCFCACGNDDITNPGHDTTQKQSEQTQQGEKEKTTEPSAKLIQHSTVVFDENDPKNYAQTIIKGIPDSSAPSGFAPLPKISYTAVDPENKKGLSQKKVSHSHGPASGGKPHHTVVDFQKTFDKYGAVTLDTKSKDKTLYLTFDCGYEYENLTSAVLDTLKEKGVSATFFCTLDHIKKETDLINRMIKEGHIVGNHSTTHPSFAEISREKMAKEIEQTENYLRENFGYSAKYFRFPAGEYNESALELISSLGYKSVFWSVAYDDWDTSKVRGKAYAIEKVMSRLHPGAVILLHSVSKDNADALGEIIDKARAEGYVFKSLEEL